MNEIATKAGQATIIGKPNAGKSTLINAIIGSKLSIVTHKAQTTRKRVLGIYSSDKTQIVFVDTPGIIKPRYELQRSMMSQIDDSIEDADVILIILDVDDYIKNNNFLHIDTLNKLKKSHKTLILLLNKIDLLKDRKEVLPLIKFFNDMKVFQEIIPVSAIKSQNIDEIIKVIEQFLPESEFYYDPEQISTQNERFFVSEIIREKIFEMLSEEIPYSTEVNISEFKEREAGKWYIAADIIVEKETQKIIMIGAAGNKLKQIGAAARKDIEEHLGEEVYLELFVKIRQKWRNDKNLLKSYGY